MRDSLFEGFVGDKKELIEQAEALLGVFHSEVRLYQLDFGQKDSEKASRQNQQPSHLLSGQQSCEDNRVGETPLILDCAPWPILVKTAKENRTIEENREWAGDTSMREVSGALCDLVHANSVSYQASAN